MRLAISGSTGLIGSAVVAAAAEAGHEVRALVRRPAADPSEISWDAAAGSVDLDALAGVDAVIHLAGENIGARWTEARRRSVLASRVEGTRTIAEAIAQLDPRPALVCASAIGYYGDRVDEILTEESSRGSGFLADVVEAWEQAAQPARAAGARVVHLRNGIVLASEGGALAKLLTPFRLGLGGRVGAGSQWWSWIGLADTAAAYLHAATHALEGVVNVTAPTPVTNAQLVKALGRALHRPTVLPLPGFAVRAAFGQMGQEMLLEGQRVLPARLLDEGFAFAHPTVDEALAAALGRG
jgi:uncharacterized protein (TIGR01777 family)